jgi:undecaprenyl-diphosphatase
VGLVVAFLERRRLANRAGPKGNVFLYLAIVIGGQWVIAQLIKLGVGRTRPILGIAAGLDGSFPSGHSASASATYAACALVIGMSRSRRAQTLLTGAAVAIAVAVASSRVLLGLHWFSDVLGGLALGWAWFALVSLAFGGRLLRFGAPVELAERHETLQEQDSGGARQADGRAGGSAGWSAPSSRISSSKSER